MLTTRSLAETGRGKARICSEMSETFTGFDVCVVPDQVGFERLHCRGVISVSRFGFFSFFEQSRGHVGEVSGTFSVGISNLSIIAEILLMLLRPIEIYAWLSGNDSTV